MQRRCYNNKNNDTRDEQILKDVIGDRSGLGARSDKKVICRSPYPKKYNGNNTAITKLGYKRKGLKQIMIYHCATDQSMFKERE